MKFLLYLGCLLLASCKSPPEETYTVAVSYLPKDIDPAHNMVNVFHFANLQMFYPLMRRSIDSRELESHFLNMERTQATSPRLNRYRFCLRDDVVFSNGRPISTEALQGAIKSAHARQRRLPAIQNISSDRDCIDVELADPEPRYFDRLSSVASTILDDTPGEAGEDPVGLGDYRLTERDDMHLDMEYTGTEKPRFSRISMVKVSGLHEAIERGIIDVSLLFWEPNREALLSGYTQVSYQIMRTHALIVPFPQEQLRTEFIRCFDRDTFLEILKPLDLRPLPGLLPYGTLGSAVDFSRVKHSIGQGQCSFPEDRPTVIYRNHLLFAQSQLEDFFRDPAGHLPIRVNVIYSPMEENVIRFSRHEEFMYVVGLDSPAAQTAEFGDPAEYMESFYAENRFIPQPFRPLEEAVKRADMAQNEEERGELYSQAHEILLRSGHIVPLGLLPPYLYYRGNIHSFDVADRVIGSCARNTRRGRSRRWKPLQKYALRFLTIFGPLLRLWIW